MRIAIHEGDQMKELAMLGHIVIGLLVGTLVSLTALLGVGYGTEEA
jgi:hypothetical protein